jgi:hypothetical protein
MRLGGIGLGFALVTVVTRSAHHGHTGRYDRSRPVYINGTLAEVDWGYPHAQLTIDIPSGVRLPNDLSRFSELDRLDDRDTVSRLTPAQAGRIEVILPPNIMGDIIPSPDRPERGDRLEAVAYQRCPQGSRYDGEWRVQALTTTTGEVLFRSVGAPTGFSDGCAGQRPRQSPSPHSSATTEPTTRPTDSTAPSADATDENVPIVPIAAAGLGAAAVTAVIWVIRRRRSVGGR